VPEVIDVNIQLGEMVARFAFSANRDEREERRQVRALISENERKYRTEYERLERFTDNSPKAVIIIPASGSPPHALPGPAGSGRFSRRLEELDG